MSESASSIAIDGEAATKALESLRKFAEAPRKGKTAAEKASGDAIRLVFGLKDKEEYKSGEMVMINLKYALESADDEYEIVFITKGDASKLRNQLDKVRHLTTVSLLLSCHA